MNPFKTGDRVEYVAVDEFALNSLVGSAGTVQSVNYYNVVVNWDDLFTTSSHPHRYLKAVDPDYGTGFNPGDRIEYTGGKGGPDNDALMGRTGTVKDVTSVTNVRINWDISDTWIKGVYPENIEKVTPDTATFKVGDRVKYTGRGGGSHYIISTNLMGKTGTVNRVDFDSLNVTWDDGTIPNGVFQDNVEKLPEISGNGTGFKVGDRVSFTGKHSSTFANDSRMGSTGTVEGFKPGLYEPVNVRVRWDNDPHVAHHFPRNLERLYPISDPWAGLSNLLKTSPVPNVASGATVALDIKNADALREEADRVEALSDAYAELAMSYRDTADAIDAVNNNL